MLKGEQTTTNENPTLIERLKTGVMERFDQAQERIRGAFKKDITSPYDKYLERVNKLNADNQARKEAEAVYTHIINSSDRLSGRFTENNKQELVGRLADLEVLGVPPEDISKILFYVENGANGNIHNKEFIKNPEVVFVALAILADIGEASKFYTMIGHLKTAEESASSTKRRARKVLTKLQKSAEEGGLLAMYTASKRTRSKNQEACDRDAEYVTTKTGVEIDPSLNANGLVTERVKN